MVAFVILHYKNIKDTLECISSIKSKLPKKEYKIVVVDNASCKLKEAENLQKACDLFIQNKENMGFAKANNIGCKKAIEKFKLDYLIVINNDTLILQEDFLERIKKSYEKVPFDIMGTKIITSSGYSINPFPGYDTFEKIEKAIRREKKLLFIYQSELLSKLLQVYLKMKNKNKKLICSENGKKSRKDIMLHGCALIFSEKYFTKYATVFFDETFLYHEEEFLYYRVKRDHLTTYYNAEMEIFHKEGSALNYSFSKDENAKNIFRTKEILKSLILLRKMIIRNEKI